MYGKLATTRMPYYCFRLQGRDIYRKKKQNKRHKEVLSGHTTRSLSHIVSYKSIDLAAGASPRAPLRVWAEWAVNMKRQRV